jgi:hypothetical protein
MSVKTKKKVITKKDLSVRSRKQMLKITNVINSEKN